MMPIQKEVAPEYLIRNNDSIYSEEFKRRVRSLDVKQIESFEKVKDGQVCFRVVIGKNVFDFIN